MRISKTRLRRIIRDVIIESREDEMDMMTMRDEMRDEEMMRDDMGEDAAARFADWSREDLLDCVLMADDSDEHAGLVDWMLENCSPSAMSEEDLEGDEDMGMDMDMDEDL